MLDQAAFAALVDRCQRPLRAYLAGIGLPVDAADDVAQEVFLAYFRDPDRRPSACSELAWLKGIARNQAYAWLRRHRQEPRCLALAELAEAALDAGETWEDERLEQLHRCLMALPAASRRLLVAHYGEGVSSDELAVRTGRRPGAVRMALLRLREHLRACIDGRQAEGG